MTKIDFALSANYFSQLKIVHAFNVCISFSNCSLEKYFGTRFDKTVGYSITKGLNKLEQFLHFVSFQNSYISAELTRF